GVAVNGTIAVTATSGTLTITITSSSSRTANALTWQNIRVRPSAGTPLASGNIVKSGTASMPGVTPNSTSFGTLIEVAGAANAYRITAATTTPVAGASDALTIRLVDRFGNTVTTFSGTKTLTFSGLGSAPDGSLSTVTDNTATAKNLGTAT